MDKESGKRKRILVITYAFPPVAYVGVHRTLKYCRYLSSHQWMPVVLTSRPSGASFKDEKLCQQIPPDVEVYRTVDFDPARLIERLSRLRRRTVSGPIPTRPVGNDAKPSAALSAVAKLKRCVESLLTRSPDSHVFWLPFALLRGIRILLWRKVDVIYSTSPPHSSHIVAFLLARCFRKPYVLDFRDPWYPGGSVRNSSEQITWGLKVEAYAKSRIINGAAKVICVSKGEREELQKEFPEIEAERFAFITNGYDPVDFSLVIPEGGPTDKLTLTHAGTIYTGAAGEFFEALLQLLRNRPGIENMIQVRLLGEISQEYVEIVRTLASKGIVQIYGLQPHASALRMMMETDVAVILLGGSTFLSSEIPAKTFEYLFVGKPILAIAEEGDLTEMLRQSGLGIVVRPRSPENVADALWALVADRAAGRLTRVPNQSYIRSFERAVLAEKLARMLDAVKEAELVRQ